MGGHGFPAVPTGGARVGLGHTGVVLNSVIEPATGGKESPEEECKEEISEETFEEEVFIDDIVVSVPEVESAPKGIRPVPGFEFLRSPKLV